jgi:uncharacterized membrane protein YwzB
MPILSIILAILLVCVLWWAINALAGAFGLPAPVVVVLQVLLVVLFIIYLLSAFGAGPSFSFR